jgi:hypothetical protein
LCKVCDLPLERLVRLPEVAVGSYSLSLLFELSMLISLLNRPDFRVDALLLREEIVIDAGCKVDRISGIE